MTQQRLPQLAAILTTSALLVGIPWLAGLLPWPALDMTLLTWEVRLRSGQLPPGVGTVAVIIALWGVWTLYLGVLSVEILGRVRRRPVRLRYLRPLQLLAATTLGTVMVSPATVHATPATTMIADAPTESAPEDEAESGTKEQDQAGPFLVERSRSIDDFGYDSADLTEAMRADLEVLSGLINEHGAPEVPIVVTGHTDAAGDADYNLDLSQRRADAAAELLRTHVDEHVTIETRGEGSRHLIDGVDDSAQRRVEIAYSVVVTPPQPSTGEEPGSNQDEGPSAEDGQSQDAEDEPQGLALALSTGAMVALVSGLAGFGGGVAVGRRSANPTHRHRGEDNGPQEDLAAETDPPRSPADDEDEQDLDHLSLLDLTQTPGLGVTGPGARAAARTLIHTALTSPSPSDLHVVIPTSDLHELLDGTRAPALLETAPVAMTDTIDDALTLLQLEILNRHRAADDADDSDHAAPEPPVQFVLIANADAARASEITSLLRHTQGMHISAVLLGRWPHGATCTIASDGGVTHADEPFAHLVGTRWEGTSTEHLRHALRRHRVRGTPSPEPRQSGSEPGSGRVQEEHRESSGEPRSPTPRSVSVTVLGHISLSVDGTRVRPHRRSALEVMAYLAAHPAGARLDAVVDAMWPADTGHRGIRRFHDACTAIRTACRPALGELATQVIAHDNDLYRLNSDLVSCDLWRLHQLLDDSTAGDDTSVLVSNAAAGYEEFAADTDYVWADGPRVRLRTRLIAAMLKSASRAEPMYAKSILHRAAEIDPRDTEVAHDLVRLYLDSGDDRTARRIYDQHRKSLQEIGEEPEEKTSSLLSGF
ncbi:OmpA family protein [Nocardiopsis sp. NRRL B-16309]|uniref:OmpA family protein n=1 Tax=Nocardiopsis sp. NRRL B-16309 TaxID=1519494 RepID=UPI0006ADA27E|nr:OmpA family protein [Nocardiopsis sp. NRRL B-16309]KOX23825.1 hypothetical protein ADL05_01855 [Nocardiopsis sp. NRRL B-16309]